MITKETPLKDALKLAPACSCSACSHGCTMGSGVLSEQDFKPLADFLKVSVDDLKKKHLEKVTLFHSEKYRPKLERGDKPYGKCSFFKDNKCSVHSVKPLQCKLAMGCKDYGEDLMIWFMLNELVNTDDAQSLREYAQYLKSGGKTIPGGELEKLSSKEVIEKVMSYEILR